MSEVLVRDESSTKQNDCLLDLSWHTAFHQCQVREFCFKTLGLNIQLANSRDIPIHIVWCYVLDISSSLLLLITSLSKFFQINSTSQLLSSYFLWI